MLKMLFINYLLIFITFTSQKIDILMRKWENSESSQITFLGIMGQKLQNNSLLKGGKYALGGRENGYK